MSYGLPLPPSYGLGWPESVTVGADPPLSHDDTPPPFADSLTHITTADVRAYIDWMKERVQRLADYWMGPQGEAPVGDPKFPAERGFLTGQWFPWLTGWNAWAKDRDDSCSTGTSWCEPWWTMLETAYDDVRDWHKSLLVLVDTAYRVGFRNIPAIASLPDNQILPSIADLKHGAGHVLEEVGSTLKIVVILAAVGLGGYLLLEHRK